jgi:hypothetical protein
MTMPTIQPPDNLDQDERAALDRVEEDPYYTGSHTPDTLEGVHGFTRAEIDAITSKVQEDQTLDPETRSLLSRDKIVGFYLLAYGRDHPDPKDRSPDAAKDFVVDQAASVGRPQLADARSSPPAPVTQTTAAAQTAAAGPQAPAVQPAYGGQPHTRGRRFAPAQGQGGGGGAVLPIVNPLPCKTSAKVLGVDDAVVLDTIEPFIDPANIQAAAQLAYITSVGDGLRVFATRDALVDRWARLRQFEFKDNAIKDYLYCAWRRDDDLSAAERRLATASVFGIPADGLPAGARINRGFLPAFNGLLAALLAHNHALRHRKSARIATRTTANLAARQLRWNLQHWMSNVTLMQIRELRERFDNDVALLDSDEVVDEVAAGDPDGIWAVVTALLDGANGATVNLVTLHEAAVARNDLFTWLTFSPGDGSDAEVDAFDEAVEAAVVLDATERYLTGRPSQVLSGDDRPVSLAGAGA